MTIKSLRRLKLSEPTIKRLLEDICTIPGLRGDAWHRTSPDIIECIMGKIYHALGDTDPFFNIKNQINAQVIQMEPFARKLISLADDPVLMAAKLAILGNAIDFMMPGGTRAIKASIQEKLSHPLSEKSYRIFKEQLSKTQNIVYFTDNCGEIIFDKLFIKILKQNHNATITVVVRKIPTLNDATKKEAADIGLDEVADVMDNGIDGPLPGTIIKRCSKKVQALVNKADLIIAKGGGNFDSLHEQIAELKTNITFMLLSKCHPINSYFGTTLHQPVLANFFTK